MIIDKSYYFNVNISSDIYADKKDATESICSTKLAKKNGHEKKMSFNIEYLCLDEFEKRITSGHSYCGGLFIFPADFKETFVKSSGAKYTTGPFYKDGSLKAQFKSDRYFTSGQVISLDIDKTMFSPEDFVSTLSLKPTFFYTSPSDSPGNRKFRLVYVIDTLLNKDAYEMATKALHILVEIDTGEKIKDTCGERFSQYFNGNTAAQCWKTYNVLQPSDLMPIIKNFNIEPSEKPELEGLFSRELLVGMDTLAYKDFMHFNSWKYKYFWNSIEFGEDEEYRIINPSLDIILLFRWNDKFKDGEGRRKRLQKYAALRRIAKPNITPDELLFNLYVDRYRFFDNSDGALTLDVLKRKVEIAFKKNIYELRKDYEYILKECPYKFVINPKFRYKAQEIINRAGKEIRWAEIDRYYDRNKSLKDNLENLKTLNIKIKKTALYEYCRDRKIDTKALKNSEKELILSLYSPSLTQKENLLELEKHGIKISRRKLMRIVGSKVGSSSQKEENTATSNSYMSYDDDIIIVETEKVPTPEFPAFVIPDFNSFVNFFAS